MKVTISINDDLLTKIDSFAKDNFMSRSGFIALAARNYLLQNETLDTMKSLKAALNKVSENGVVDPQSAVDLENFNRIAEMLGK